MTKNISHHPVLLYPQAIKAICKPLQQLQITYFSHVRVNHEGAFSAISNHPEFHEHYLKNKYYNVDIHMEKGSDTGKYVIWDSIDCTGLSKKMDVESEEHGIKHTFTIIENSKHGKEYYHFATNSNDKSINNEYLRHLELLRLFILYFNEKIEADSRLALSHQLTFKPEQKASEFLFPQLNSNKARSAFIKDLNLARPPQYSKLSLRELEMLHWLHYGKSLSHIALILGIKEITVKKHIENIKAKTNCYTLFQLGEYYYSLVK